jgi:putative ABC transport system permease protein
MILLRLISWPYFRKHVLRSLLTTAGIVLGVAVFVGMHTANQSVLFAFSRTVDRIAGKTELQVTAGETGFDEAVLEKVQASPSVRVAVPVIEAVVDTKIAGEGNILVLGVDMTGDRSLRDYDLDSGDEAVVDDPLVFLAQPDSLILTREFADKNRIAIGRRLPLDTAEGDKAFTVRGIMKSSGLTTAFGGNLAIMDIYAAQKMFGRGRKFDRIDLAVKEGRTIVEAEGELRALLGPGFQVDPPSGRGQQFEQMLAAYSIMVSVSSVFALFIGMFIIYNSFAIAVAERRAEIGILRALGATRRQIRLLFLGESAVTGLVGSLAGLAFGLLIARGIAASIGTLISDVYGVAPSGRSRRRSPAARLGAGDRHRHQRGRGARPGAERSPRRSRPRPAEGQVSGAVGRRKPAARGGGIRARRCVRRVPGVLRIARRVLRRLFPGAGRGAAAQPAALAGAGAGDAAAPAVAAAG